MQQSHKTIKEVEVLSLKTNLYFVIPKALKFHIEVYYYVDRLLIGLSTPYMRWTCFLMVFKENTSSSLIIEKFLLPHIHTDHGLLDQTLDYHQFSHLQPKLILEKEL